MVSEREKKLEDALAQFLRPVKGIPFEVVVKAMCGFEVYKFDRAEPSNDRTLTTIVEAMRNVCRTVQANPIKRPRPNEVGNDMEPFVIRALRQEGLTADDPKTVSGKGKAMGYPDARIDIDDKVIYLEIKTYAAKNRQTSQRSFYFSPSDDSKVTSDACHLLVGFEIEQNENLFTPVAFEIVDLYGLECDVKSEFNSDNNRLYGEARLLVKERVPPQ